MDTEYDNLEHMRDPIIRCCNPCENRPDNTCISRNLILSNKKPNEQARVDFHLSITMIPATFFAFEPK